MKITTIRELRHNFRKVESWINQGSEVLITKRGKPMFRICLPEGFERKRPYVDFRKIRNEVSAAGAISKKDVASMWKILRDEREV